MKPSDLYHITSDVNAFFFDRAITTWGITIENELNAAGADAKTTKEGERKRERVLQRWLGIERKFKDPAAGSANVVAASTKQGPVSL